MLNIKNKNLEKNTYDELLIFENNVSWLIFSN